MWDVLPAADLLTQPFGCVPNAMEWIAPWCPSQRFHSGVDLGSTHGGASICRSPVYATRAGVVVRIGFPNGLGDQAVFLRLDQGGWLIYGHLEAALVLLGERVAVGQEVGLLGTRGLSTACHLHLEYRTDGPFQGVPNHAAGVADPAPFLYAASDMDANDPNFQALIWRVKAILDNRPTVENGPTKGEANQLHVALAAQPAPGATAALPPGTKVQLEVTG